MLPQLITVRHFLQVQTVGGQKKKPTFSALRAEIACGAVMARARAAARSGKEEQMRTITKKHQILHGRR